MAKVTNYPGAPLGCCRPQVHSFPSGDAWAHAPWCKVARNQKIRPERTSGRSGGHPSRSPLPPDQPHEACRVSYADGGTVCGRCAPLLHPFGHDCGQCRYADAHADIIRSDGGQ